MRKHFLNKTHFSVLGMGRSGLAAARLLASFNKDVDAYDTRELEIDLEGVNFHPSSNAISSKSEVLVASPGAPPRSEVFENLAATIVSEVEIGWEASNAKTIAITGTDGKTTTTELIHHLLKNARLSSVACGNIGIPVSEVVLNGEHEYLVLEISAFQLWSTHFFKPEVVVFTNIAEDHVDYFSDFSEYVAAKKRLMKNATRSDVGVFNASDPYVQSWAGTFPGRVFSYGLEKPDFGEMKMWVEEGTVFLETPDAEGTIEFVKIADLNLIGDHNALNIMAATLAFTALELDINQARLGLSSFEAPRHRLQKLGVHLGIQFYNDSKATNAHAAIAGLQNLPLGLTVIAGGLDKGLQLDAFCELLTQRAKSVVLIGEIGNRLRDALIRAGHENVHLCDSLLEAVDLAIEITEEGGVISLSPACSSFDMFDSYAQRGEIFMDIVAAK